MIGGLGFEFSEFDPNGCSFLMFLVSVCCHPRVLWSRVRYPATAAPGVVAFEVSTLVMPARGFEASGLYHNLSRVDWVVSLAADGFGNAGGSFVVRRIAHL